MSDDGAKSQETPEAAHGQPRPEIRFNLEAISKLAAFGTVLAYAVGLVVVNTYLFNLGVSEFDLFRTRFIATGLLVITIVLVATAGLAISSWLIFQYARSKGTPITERIFTFLVALVAGVAPWALYVRVLRQTRADAILLYIASAILGLCIAQTVRRIRYPRTHVHFTPRLYYRVLKRVRPRSADVWENEQGSWKHPDTPGWLSVVGWLSLVVAYAFLTLSAFVSSVYPSIPEQFGGGSARLVRVLISEDAKKGVQELGVSLEESTVDLWLLFEGSSFFVFETLVEDETEDGAVVRLGKDDILGIQLNILVDPPTTEPPIEAPTSSLPGPTSTRADFGKKGCSEGGCTVWGPCPEGPDHPPASHWICTPTTKSAEQQKP